MEAELNRVEGDVYAATVRRCEELEKKCEALAEGIRLRDDRVTRLEAQLKKPFFRRFRDFDRLHRVLIELAYGGDEGIDAAGARGFSKLVDQHWDMMPLSYRYMASHVSLGFFEQAASKLDNIAAKDVNDEGIRVFDERVRKIDENQ